jgi:hypothetical protein
MTDSKKNSDADRPEPSQTEVLDIVSHALSQIRFGAIHVTLHDGKAVQVDITERKRFSS